VGTPQAEARATTAWPTIIERVTRRNGILTGLAVVFIAAIAGGVLVIRRPKVTPVAPATAAVPAVFEGLEANLTGRVQARTTELVGAPIAGTLESYFVELNQEVYQGQLLGRIRNAQLEGAEQQAQTDVEKTQARLTSLGADGIAARMEVSRASADKIRARAELDRLEKFYQRQQLLMKEGATPRLTFDKAEKDYQAAKHEFETLDSVAKQAEERVTTLARDLEAERSKLAEVTEATEKAKAAVAAGEIRSPADGVVTSRRGQPGESVDPSMKNLVQIATGLTSMQVVATAEPGMIGRIHAGQAATVRLPDTSAEELPGTVREARGAEVIVDFISPKPILQIGITAQVRIKL